MITSRCYFKITPELVVNCVLFVIGIMIWLIFYPGLLSVDSIDQYTQAYTRQFTNWHPPIMSVVLSLLFKIGGGVSTITFFQVQLGLFGIKSLIYQLTNHAIPNHEKDKSSLHSAASLLIISLLLLPVTPLIFYLVTFWKDTWVAIALIWVITLILKLASNLSSLTNFRILLYIISISSTGIILSSARHNAKILLPFLIATVAYLVKHIFFRSQLLLLLTVPIIAFFFFSAIIEKSFNVQNAHIENIAIASDLVGMCVVSPDVCGSLPLTRKGITDEKYKQKYMFGISAHFYHDDYLIVDPDYVGIGKENKQLKREYQNAIVNFPIVLLKVKYHAFLNMLRPKLKSYNWTQTSIEENVYNLKHTSNLKYTRTCIIKSANFISEHKYFHWISGEHLIWLTLNALLLLFALYQLYKIKSFYNFAILATLAITLIYYLTYLIATTQWDFRFMYPSTLIIQIVLLSFTFSSVTRNTKTRKVKPKNHSADS